jgi:hypothetical protein
MVVLLPELWRPGNDAGPQPRIAEGAARDVDRLLAGMWGDRLAPEWLEV